jgi:hypothetical protein
MIAFHYRFGWPFFYTQSRHYNFDVKGGETVKHSRLALQFSVLLPVLLLWVPLSFAAPNEMNFQGRITDDMGNSVTDGVYEMRFRIYDALTDGNLQWEETQDVNITDGVYSVILGTGTTLTGSFDAALFEEDGRWLEVWVEGEQLTPRQKITSVAYALQAQEAVSVVNDAITKEMLKDEAVVQAKIANNAVSSEKIADGTITKDDLDIEFSTDFNADTLDNKDSTEFAPSTHAHSTLNAADGSPGNAIYVDDSGKVGIGNVAPVAPLSIGTLTAGGNVYIGAIDGTNEGSEIAWEGAGDYTNWITDVYQNDFRLWNFSLTPNLLSIYNLNPLAPTGLYVQGNASLATISQIGTLTLSSDVTDNAGSYTNGLVFANHSYMPELGPWAQAAIWTDGKTGYSGELVLGTDGDGGRNTTGIVERMRIDKNGNVGIGTDSPTHKLHVNGLSQFEVGGGSIAITTPGGEPGFIAFSQNGHRRDIQYHNSGISLTVSDSSSAPSYDNGMLIHESGHVEVKVLQITGGGDIAEPFDIQKHDSVKEGMVMVIDPDNPGKLKISDKAYDRKVAGIVSGAGGVNPGMLMTQKGSAADGTTPIALTGRVYCLADASQYPIEPGDMLTTSNTPGHAMKVREHGNAHGAILGKAMTALESGTGLVLVLVALQ